MLRFKVLGLFVAGFALCLALAGCAGSSQPSDTSDTASDQTAAAVGSEEASADSQATEAGSQTAETAVQEAGASAEDALAAVTPERLANVDVSIEFGQYDECVALSQQISNGELTGQVVRIDGEVINFDPTMSFGIGERSADESQAKGPTFVIIGLDGTEYPQDRTHAIVTGMVLPDPDYSYAFKIYTLPEFVEVVE